MSDCLIIFTRYPEPGKTKTRLIPALGAEQAAKLQQTFTESTLQKAQTLSTSVQIEVHFANGNTQKMQDWLGQNITVKPQFQGNLGQRMAASFQQAFESGNQRVVIIGIDCPDLTPALLQKAFTLLQNQDLVLGKALDGGYYLIGLQHLIPALFQNIAWGTDTVLQQTVEIATKLQLQVAYLPTLRDIDTPEDLAYLN
ncbi:MAG: TIGR04282 family arsenosugar biosynthesis glycosyltransferase [Spirulinaceae cyanobacterium]